jgi:hypothetical protein
MNRFVNCACPSAANWRPIIWGSLKTLSDFYNDYEPTGESAENLLLMRLLDEQYNYLRCSLEHLP